MRFDGKIKTWDDDRGFGFIESTQGGQDIFVHIKGFSQRAGRPQAGQSVSFEIEIGLQGKKRAKNVEPLRPQRATVRNRGTPPARRGAAGLAAVPAFALLYIVVQVFWAPPFVLAMVYLVASLLTFLVYAFDKSAAERRAWRTPESTLHMLALAGGWPGALFAQHLLRHKSSKAAFRSVFWGTVALNIVGFVVLCSPAGRHLLPMA